MNSKAFINTGLFVATILFVAALRNAGVHGGFLSPLAGWATPLYIAATIGAIVMFRHMGVSFDRLGFGLGIRWYHLLLALAGVALLQLSAATIGPLLEQVFGAGRDLSRFAAVEGSLQALLVTLALSWTLAAFGEELAFRIVMLRGIALALGESRAAWVIAVLLQALVFGLVHLYQGPVGVIGATISGLVFGTLTVLARGSIWPAALAHGTNNTIGLLAIYTA